jgi:sugar phosphate isomerase/epimerase
MASPSRALGAATYTYLYSCGLLEALRRLAELGVGLVELTVAPPHVDRCILDRTMLQRVRNQIAELGMTAVSVNPTYLDINLVSLNTDMREASFEQLKAALRLGHDLEVPMLVVFAGRRHPLAPAPRELVDPLLFDQLGRLLKLSEELGVGIGLENGPTLVLDKGEDVAEVCRVIGSPWLRAVFDVANSHMVEEPSVGLPHVLPYLSLVHLSDTTRARWEHSRVGSGEVAFGPIATVLDTARYEGPSIMEIVDLERPTEGLTSSARRLADDGWQLANPLRTLNDKPGIAE